MTLRNIIKFFFYGVLIGLAIGYYNKTHAGPYLDLALGTPASDYHASECVPEGTATVTESAVHINCKDGHYVGDSGLLGKIAVGYETKTLPVWKVNIGGYAELEHISDPRTSDGGLNAVWLGVRIQ
jgi:hypothetical protein